MRVVDLILDFLIRLSKRAPDDQPMHRMFSWTSMLIPISIEKIVYQPGNYRFAYLYVFGIRIARWNCVK